MNRTIPSSFVAIAFCALALTLAATASAQPRGTRVQPGSDGRDVLYEFLDDPLQAGGIAPSGGGIIVRNRRMRTLLIRPRTQFINEMLKSVENI